MKSTKFYKKIIAAGLIVLSLALLLKNLLHLPDFFIGLFFGIGLGLEIYSILMLIKLRKTKIV